MRFYAACDIIIETYGFQMEKSGHCFEVNGDNLEVIWEFFVREEKTTRMFSKLLF